MSSLIVASLVRNERGRFWDRALATWRRFADDIVVLDDGSEDGSREIAEAYDARVIPRDGPLAWGSESPARATLFEAAWSFARVDDYILVLDADMTPASDPRILTETGADAVFFPLYDLWTPTSYREDEFWRGHLTPRVWMVKKRKLDVKWAWPTRGVHCGHFPTNLEFESFAYATPEHALLHYAYVAPELREEKYVAYAKVAAQLSDFERRHAISILDPEPSLVRLPFEPELSLV